MDTNDNFVRISFHYDFTAEFARPARAKAFARHNCRIHADTTGRVNVDIPVDPQGDILSQVAIVVATIPFLTSGQCMSYRRGREPMLVECEVAMFIGGKKSRAPWVRGKQTYIDFMQAVLSHRYWELRAGPAKPASDPIT